MYLAALCLSLLCLIGVVVFYVRSPAFSVFHPLSFYAAFHALVFVVRPILVWAVDWKQMYYTYEFTPSISDKITVLMASNLGFLAFAYFSLRFGNQPMRFSHDEALQEEKRRLSQIFVWVVLICGPPALYSLVNSYGANSVYDGLQMDTKTGVAINTKNVGYVTDLQLMGVTLTAMFAWLNRFRLYALLPLVAFGLLRAGTGGRYAFVLAAVMTSLFFLYERRSRLPGFKVTVAALMLASAFVAIGADRGAGLRQTIGLEEKDVFERRQDTDFFLLGMDFANLEFFEYLVYVIPQRSGTYDYFLDNLQIFTEPVPRILWTGKPIGEPLRRISLFDYGYPIGMTRSLPGEGWYAAGWFGVLIWCSLWGSLLGLAYRKFVATNKSTFGVACYIVILPTLIAFLRDGLLLTLVRQSGVYLAPIFVWFMLSKYMGVPRAAQLRQMLTRRKAAAVAGQGSQAMAPSAHGPVLPPAVARRRAYLEGLTTRATLPPAE